MEVDVRLIIFVVIFSVTAAQDGDSKDLTDNLLYHCGWCLKNISRAACMMLGNGSLSCVTCREHKIAHEVDLLCGYCPTRNDRTVTDLPIQNSCETCVCNGTTSKKRLKRCVSMDQGRCFSCQSNRTGVYCELCGRGKLHVCQIESEGDKVEPQRSTGFSRKETIIVSVCCVFGVVVLAVSVFLLHRHCKCGKHSAKKQFCTVELTNRNYDDLDFSLLSPITDVPFVYRTDVGEFDNEALLASEKPQLEIMDADSGEFVA